MAHRPQRRAAENHQSAEDEQDHRRDGDVAPAQPGELQGAEYQHECEAHGQCPRAHHVGPAERRRFDEPLVRSVVHRVRHDEEQKQDRGPDRERLQHRLQARRDGTDQGGKPHVLLPLQRDDGAQHGEPEEQDGCQLVRPDERRMQHEPEYDAGQQDYGFGQHDGSGDGLHQAGQQPLPGVHDRHQRAGRARSSRQGLLDDGHESGPTTPSNVAQASSPNRRFHSV